MRVKLLDSFLSKAKEHDLFKMTWLKVIMVCLALFGVRFFLVDEAVNPALMYLNSDLQIIFMMFTLAMLVSCLASMVDLNEQVMRLSQKCHDLWATCFTKSLQRRQLPSTVMDHAHHSAHTPRRHDTRGVHTHAPSLGMAERQTVMRVLPDASPQAVSPATQMLVILDSDPMLTEAWLLRGQMRGIRVIAFNTLTTFKSILLELPLETPIYIDYHLQDEMTSLALAKQLAIFGFKNLYLCTGHHPHMQVSMPWIKQVVGKAPCF